MKAAIYARKSTDDNDKNPENKSVTRQVERARAYAEQKGWTVDEAHIFVDDDVSGFKFGKHRPGLLRLLNAVKEYDVVVMSELSRLGREQAQTSSLFHDLYAKGKRVYFYLTDEEVRFESAIDKFMLSAHAFGAEIEREKAAQRSLDALARKASNGFSAGGACYGYDLVPVYAQAVDGKRVRSATNYAINREQAKVIIGIHRAYADGCGHTMIAKAMNGNCSEFGPTGQRRTTARRDLDAIRQRYFEGSCPPSPQQGKRGTGSWAPSMIREVLYRERYTGKVPFAGQSVERPDLQIIDEQLWQRVQQRLKAVRATYIRDGAQWWGRPSVEKYLLTGMGRCSCCGKAVAAIGGYVGTPPNRRKMTYYCCSYHHTRGATVCENDHRAHMEWLDRAVIEAIRQQVLTPQAIAYATEEAAAIIERTLKETPDKGRQLEAEANKLHRELERFMRLIADGKAPDTVLAEIKRREQRLTEVERESRALAYAPAALSPAEIRKLCGERLARFDALLLGDVPVARQALRKLLPEPLKVTPATADGRRTLSFEGVTVLGPLLDPNPTQPASKGLASPRGFEPRLPP
jgi:site-specific DNA recombinase